jgi:type VI secretion system secreted protein Hcp
MAVDMFLELHGIKGESLDKVHKGKIDILGWTWGLTNTGTFHQGHGGGGAKASFRDISITKYVDAATPDLVHSCASGKHFEKGKIIIRKAGQHPLEYLTIELDRVFVAAYSTAGKGVEERLTEIIGLNFAKVRLEYATQTEKGGRGAAHVFHWDISSNSKVDW